MDESHAQPEQIEFSAHASLVALGLWFQQLGIWAIVAAYVTIKQKVRRYTPLDKLLDCLITMLAGGGGVVESNTRVRPDRAVQLAFGRQNCAEQSTISRTLTHCTAENVLQMRAAINAILRQHSQAYRHDYAQALLVADIDVTGVTAGRQGEGVEKGYFAHARNRRGRQLGRVLATQYEEILVDRLYTGKRQLDQSLPELVDLMEVALELTENRRKCTLLRVDAGGGDDDNVELILARGYHLLIKLKQWRRAQKVASSVVEWYVDPKQADREVGWVMAPHAYCRPTRQMALRKRKDDGTWSYHGLVFTLDDEGLFQLAGEPMPPDPDPRAVLLAALHAYDKRGGGLETENRGDKQGLGLSRRNKQRFAAQEMLALLAQLAHNLVIWARNSLVQVEPRLEKYGVQRTVRDALSIAGHAHIDAEGRVRAVVLNPRHPLAEAFRKAFGCHDL